MVESLVSLHSGLPRVVYRPLVIHIRLPEAASFFRVEGRCHFRSSLEREEEETGGSKEALKARWGCGGEGGSARGNERREEWREEGRVG